MNYSLRLTKKMTNIFVRSFLKFSKIFILVFVLKVQFNYPKPINDFLFSNFRFRNQKFNGKYEHLRNLRQILQSSVCYTELHNVIRTGRADKSLARPGRKQARKHVRDARDFNNIETWAVIRFFFFFLQGKAPKEIHAILTETLACFLPGRAKDLSVPLHSD